MKLPGEYNATTRNTLEQEDLLNFKKRQDVELANGERLIMRDTNNVRYQVYVDTSGNVKAVAL